MNLVRLKILAVVAVLCACSVALAQPKLSLDKMEVDLGIIYSGARKVSRFTVKNIGSEPLKIIEVVPSCGCTTIKKPKAELKPGESDDIEIEFNASGYRTKAEKYINISSNDPSSQYVAVKILADIREELEPSTQSLLLWLGSVALGKETQQTIGFKNISGHPITIKGASGSSPKITVKAEKKTLQPDESVSVTVVVKADKEGYSNEHFALETDSKNQPKVEMKVSYIGVKEN